MEYSVPLAEGKRSCAIFWRVCTAAYINDKLDGKSVFRVSVHVNSKGYAISKSLGLKLNLTVLDEDSNVIKEEKTYSSMDGSRAINTSYSNWAVKMEDIPPDCPFIKICCTYQVFDLNQGTIPAQADPTKPQITRPGKDAEKEHCKELALVLDKDRKTGISTDAVLKLGQTEFKVHKCVLSLQSDFFKACFSDRWDSKDGDPRVVDMNDSELSPELLEALISGAYTGKVKDFDTAVKILPLADKYQFHTLKGVCERLISGQLTRENVLMVYMMATQCRALELQKKCETLVKI